MLSQILGKFEQSFTQLSFLSSGNLLAEDEVLDWLVHQVEEDEIEEVTDEMLDRLIDRTEHLAVLFCELEGCYCFKVQEGN